MHDSTKLCTNIAYTQSLHESLFLLFIVPSGDTTACGFRRNPSSLQLLPFHLPLIPFFDSVAARWCEVKNAAEEREPETPQGEKLPGEEELAE